MKPLRFTTHAMGALHERQIDPDWVEATVRHPDWVLTDPEGADVGRHFKVICEYGPSRASCGGDGNRTRSPYHNGVVRHESPPPMSPTVHYDPESDAAYIRFSKDTVLESEEVSAGVVLDYDADGRIVGMEVLNASTHLSPTVLKDAA